MDEYDRYCTDTETLSTTRPRRISFAWPALLLVAWVLYELTHQPMLAVIALCTKFGWDDFRTARWLRRRDPQRSRGWASAFLYLASGLWKMAIIATLMIFAYILMLIIHRAVGGQGLDVQAVGMQMAGAILVTLGGILFSTVAVWLAIGLALMAPCKLWLHATVHSARRQDIWPPPNSATPRANYLDILVWTTLFAVGGPTVLISLSLLVAMLAGPLRRGGPGAAMFLTAAGGMLVLAGLLARWLVRGVINRKVVARRPSECWTAESAPAAQGALT